MVAAGIGEPSLRNASRELAEKPGIPVIGRR